MKKKKSGGKWGQPRPPENKGELKKLRGLEWEADHSCLGNGGDPNKKWKKMMKSRNWGGLDVG